ncbi:g4436 [Coccomyxa viridis]|uniref:G4436 protein n=1 Tax=Coccomyxa viridis TaxID=1274662 RepID=A0ABP1FU95_9CHLO
MARLRIDEKHVSMNVPRLLQHVLLVISFRWDVQKLIYLKSALYNAHQYQTSVAIHVVCDEAAALRHVLHTWEYPVTVNESQNLDNDTNTFSLLWEHRGIMQAAAMSGLYTTYIYMEDDTGLRWSSLVSWALDQQILEPLGFSRGFYRTEISPVDGATMMLDTTEPINLTTYNRTVTVESHGSDLCLPVTSDRASISTICPNKHFVQLKRTFMGMWIASHTELLNWIQHDFWHKAQSLGAVVPDPLLDYPERTTGLFAYVDPPTGFLTRSVVPYDPERKVLVTTAEISHERNGYSIYSTEPGPGLRRVADVFQASEK